MKKKVIIVGAREDGHAKVVAHILLAKKSIEVIGFLDDNTSLIGHEIAGVKVLGSLEQIESLKASHNIDSGIVAIGDNIGRRVLTQKLREAGLEIINAIHSSVIVDVDIKIGEGCYIGQGVILVTGTKIGNCVNIHTGSTIDHDNILEDGVNIGPGVHTSGRVKIRKDAFIGVGSSIIPDIEIGERAVVGGGSVVIRNVASDSKVAGNPTRIISKLNLNG
jgi:sugar O-acyltransferase (sialic acid O-acetyltransferase NeuD family)